MSNYDDYPKYTSSTDYQNESDSFCGNRSSRRSSTDESQLPYSISYPISSSNTDNTSSTISPVMSSNRSPVGPSGIQHKSSCKSSDIDLNELPDCGLIFVSTEDSTALVAKAITKQNYSTIGFFYKTNVSGRIKVNVILVDIYRFTVPNWLGHGASLQSLIDNPLVSSVAIKGLRPIFDDNGEVDKIATGNLCSEFRQAIGLVIKNGTETSLREIISQLFGYSVENPTTGVTAIEMVNKVIASIGREDQIPQDGSLSAKAIASLNGPDVLGTDIASKSKMMQIIASNFNQQEVCNPSVANKLIQSYIVENDLFDDLQNIPLPERDPNIIRGKQEATAMLQSEYMAAGVSQFVKMLIHDQGFYQTVVAGFNETRMVSRKKDVDFKQSILELADDSRELADLLLKWINNGEVNYTELLSLISKLDDTKETVGERHRLYIDERVKLPIIENSKLLLLRKDKDKCNDSRYLVGAYLSLRDQMNEILREVRLSENDPTININQMMENVNDMGVALGLNIKKLKPVPGEYSCRAIFNVTGTRSPCVPLILKCGRQVSIPLCNPDLGEFDKQTLIEILDALDVTASKDQRFNALRRNIASRLASLSHF